LPVAVCEGPRSRISNAWLFGSTEVDSAAGGDGVFSALFLREIGMAAVGMSALPCDSLGSATSIDPLQRFALLRDPTEPGLAIAIVPPTSMHRDVGTPPTRVHVYDPIR